MPLECTIAAIGVDGCTAAAKSIALYLKDRYDAVCPLFSDIYFYYVFQHIKC